jgi:ribose transport system substrate-binding protein
MPKENHVTPRRIGAAALSLAAAALAVAGCSSASSSSTSAPASAPASTAAASAGAASTSAASAAATSSSGTGGSSAAVAAAQAAVAKAETMPTAIPETQALSSPPPKGKTVLFMQCEEVECSYEGTGMKAAAAAIGWNVKILNYQAANPATLVTALQTGLQYHPVAAFFSGVPQEAWASEQKPYAAAGAYLVDTFLPAVPTGAAIAPGRAYGADMTALGTVLADEQIADSGGAPADSLLVNVPTYPVFGPLVTAYDAVIAKDCPTCQVTDVNVTLPQMLAGGLNQAVVSAAKRDSGVKYIVSTNGSFTDTLPEALKAAGLAGQVKLISGQGVSLDQQNVLNGSQLATVSSPLTLSGWQDVDIAIRLVLHQPIPAGDGVVPWVLLTKSNIGAPSDSYDRPADYPAQFEKLWDVG